MSSNHLYQLIVRKLPRSVSSHPVDFAERQRSMEPDPAPQRMANGPSLIERLPAELYMAIVQKMDPIEGVLLSLTCRKLWAQVTLHKNVLQDLKRCSEMNETTHFLRMLEKDRCHYIACTACLRLHPRKSDETKSMGISVEVPGERRRCNEGLGVIKAKGPFSQRLVVYRDTVELVLRAGIWGQHLGLPLDCLRQRSKSNAAIVPVPVEGGGKGAHLFLKTGYVVELDLRRSLAAQIKIAEIGGCSHDTNAESGYIIKAIETARNDPINRRPADVLRCSVCPTDLIIGVFYKPREVFAGICVTAFRDLGPRGHHEDAIWRRQKALYIHRDDFDRRTQYAFGGQMLHLLWEGAEDPVDVQGKEPREPEKSGIRGPPVDEDEDSDMTDSPFD